MPTEKKLLLMAMRVCVLITTEGFHLNSPVWAPSAILGLTGSGF